MKLLLENWREYLNEASIQLYVDLDGVLADFQGGAEKTINNDLEQYGEDFERVPPRLQKRYRKMVKALLEDRGGLVVTISDFDKKSPTRINAVRNYMYPRLEADVGFWENLDWMIDGKKLWDYVKDYSPPPIILTSPMHGQESHDGKREWIQKELGIQGDSERVIVESDKWIYAAPNHILIDDTDTKIEPWRENGGIGIHHQSTDQTLDELEEWEEVFRD